MFNGLVIDPPNQLENTLKNIASVNVLNDGVRNLKAVISILATGTKEEVSPQLDFHLRDV
ncbi:MAG: hypothetical protein IPH18_18120 [Chitinophagaceae bacterium]|nr:hypothetical protein [Chitinophagaceae bacterium]